MTKIVYNACFGGFGLSPEATLRLYDLGCKNMDVTPVDKYYPPCERVKDRGVLGYEANIAKWRGYLAGEREGRNLFLTVFSPDEKFVLNARDTERTDPLLLQVIEELGEMANGACAKLAIAEVPSGSKYRIDEYDGNESVMTPDDYEWRIAP